MLENSQDDFSLKKLFVPLTTFKAIHIIVIVGISFSLIACLMALHGMTQAIFLKMLSKLNNFADALTAAEQAYKLLPNHHTAELYNKLRNNEEIDIQSYVVNIP